jgi:glycine/D-amino acid oxidase-like deaminating enzyme
MADYASISFWLATLPDAITPRPALRGIEEADVAIVGAGYSGLWTAYYLKKLAPELGIAIAEAEVAGFGASGRNGGWCTGAIAGVQGLLERPKRRAEGLALQRAAFDSVDEVGRVAEAEGIDCDYQKGGSIRVARTAAQEKGLRHLARSLSEWGVPQDDYRWLEPEACAAHVRVDGCRGGLFTPHCAALHPAKLARGLADVVERSGVRIFEQSRVTQVGPGSVRTAEGELRARFVVRATEGYTATLPGHERALLPLHSMMIATEPLPADVWKQLGLDRRQTFGDERRIVIYGQRTADDRIAFGGRAGYSFGSGIEDRFRPDDPRFERVRGALLELFPELRDAAVTHRWGGALGVPRNWRPAVTLDRATGLATLGGYVGQGVAISNLAGRTLAELIAGEKTERTQLVWVDAPSRRWEPEPLRWLAVAGVTKAGDRADQAELRGGSGGLAARFFDSFVGH